MYYLPTSSLVLFFLFSFFHPFPCSSSKHEHEKCKDQFQCGNITAGFPFWGGNRHKHCGHPLLELHCFDNITSLTISDHVYHVLHIDHTSSTLRIVRADYLDYFCSSIFINATLPQELFDPLPTFKSITFYHCNDVHPDLSRYRCPGTGPIIVSANPEYHHESCHASFTVNVPKSFDTKEKEVNVTNLKSILKKGFEVKVKIDMKACPECSSSYGLCGFNKSMPLDVKCIPPEPLTAEELHKHCSAPFDCGDQRGLLYPFWIPGREKCGHPDFELDCSRGFAEVSISSVKFRILSANYESDIIRLARVDYIDEPCPQDSLNTPFNDNVLRLASTTDLLTIYYDCNRDFSTLVSTFVKELECPNDDTRNYYVTRNFSSPPLQGFSVLEDFRRFCSRNISIPAPRTALSTLESTPNRDNLKNAIEEGFEVGVNLDCQKCMESKGACGYNQTQPSVGFVCYSRNKGLSTRAKEGIGAASALMGVILIVAGLFCVIRCQKKTSDYLRQPNLKALIPLKHYSYTQVKRITKSFAEVVGKGGFGTVYRGTLSDGSSVAVKILKDSKGNGEDFINEVASMSKTSHVNIVSLLGFSSEGSKRAIIYEYLENGSLDQFISSNTSMKLDWIPLYGIALGVARGLEYLHHGCKTRIVHFDIKPQNILLDDNLCPKVSDFGLAKLCGKKESILSLLDTRGTIGYIAPEVCSKMYGRVSHKSDVYSYGMLLLEMIGARNKERFDQNSASNTSSIYFPEWIYKDLERGDSGRLIENGISSEDAEVTKKMTLVGLWCIQPFPSDRPTMNRVVEMMEGNLDALEVPPRPVLQNPPVPLQESSTFSEDFSVYTEV